MASRLISRLRALQKKADTIQEVKPEQALVLWMQIIQRRIKYGDSFDIELPETFHPPFWSVPSGEYERIRKEVELFDRKVD